MNDDLIRIAAFTWLKGHVINVWEFVHSGHKKDIVFDKYVKISEGLRRWELKVSGIVFQ